MVHYIYNPISIIAALLANSRHRLHSVLSHPHIRCNPHQPVPAGAPGWGNRMENSSLHWHSWETEKRTQTSASLNPCITSVSWGPKEGMDVACPSPVSPTPPLFSVCLRCSCGSQALPPRLQKCSVWREWCLPLRQHLKQHKWLRKQPPCVLVGVMLMARGHSETLCFYSQRTAG